MMNVFVTLGRAFAPNAKEEEGTNRVINRMIKTSPMKECVQCDHFFEEKHLINLPYRNPFNGNIQTGGFCPECAEKQQLKPLSV